MNYYKLFNNFFKEVDSAIPKIAEKKVFVPKHKIGDKVGNQRELLANMMKLNSIKGSKLQKIKIL